MNGLDLFSGIGGLTLGLSEFVRPVAYCEQDRYCQGVLMSRMHQGSVGIAPIWDDIRTLRGEQVGHNIDIVYGGFPCQDISAAGAGKGLGGERSGLFFHIARLVEETNPRFVFLENVPAIRTRGLNGVVQTLTELGYDCRWTIVSAQEVGAPHIRKRWFLLAHANGVRLRKEQRSEQSAGEGQIQSNHNGPSQSLAHAKGKRKRESTNETNSEPISGQTRNESFDRRWWETEPDVGRVADGVPDRVDRLRGLGNAVVPLQAKTAFKRLMGLQ